MSCPRVCLRTRARVVFALLVIVSMSAAGVGADVPARLSLADAVTLALGVNANLKQSEQDYETALSRLRVAGLQTSFEVGGEAGQERTPDESQLFSRAFGSMSYENLLGTKASLDVSPVSTGDENNYLRISLRHPLTQGRGLLSEKADILAGARSFASVRNKEVYLTRQAKTLEVIERYYQAVLSREQVKVQQKAVDIAEEAADGAHKRADAGLVAGIEVSRADIRVAQTKDELNLRTQAARGALDRLTLAIGVGVGETPELTDTVPETASDTPGLTDAIGTALKNRLEMAVYDVRLSDQARRLAIAKDQFRSGVDVVAGFSSADSEPGAISTSLFGESSSNVGVEVRIPLDKRILREDRDTAERDADVLRRLRLHQMEEIAEQVRRAYLDLEEAKTSLGILTDNKKVADDNLRMAKRMVDAGLVSNREILEAQEALTRVENGLLSARTDLYLAGLNLKYAMGEDLTTVVSR